MTVTMTNAEWCIKNGYKFSDLWIVRDCSDDDDYERTYIITISGKDLYKYITTNELSYLEVMLKWLDMEHKEPILSDAEKQYLSAVIRPFRNEIKSIEKYKNWSNNSECIHFYTKKGDFFYLKDFKLGTMYKGMKAGHCYTLEELGL